MSRAKIETSWMTTSRARGGCRSAVSAPPHLTKAGRACSFPDRIIDALPQALLVLDDKLRIIVANRSFCRALRRYAAGNGWAAFRRRRQPLSGCASSLLRAGPSRRRRVGEL